MNIKTIRIPATSLMLDLVNKKTTGAPYGWIGSLVADLKRVVPADELDSVKVFGLENVYFTQEHTMSPTEILQDELAIYRAKAAELKALYRPNGMLVPDFEIRLKQIIG